MGAWGTRIYEDDDALDVRDNFMDQLLGGLTVENIEANIIEEFVYEDYLEHADVAYLALCCVELETGKLTDATKAKALEIIESGRQYEYWLEGSDKEDAAVRKRELTLIKKYIMAYDGKPVKRKSWVELQKEDKERDAETAEEGVRDKLDDVTWHIPKKSKEEVGSSEYWAKVGAHAGAFVYWLISRGYFAATDKSIQADVAKVKTGSMDVEAFLEKQMDLKIFSDDVAESARAFVTVYYDGDTVPSYFADFFTKIGKGRDAYSFATTKAEKERVAKKIDSRLKQFQDKPTSFKPASTKSDLLLYLPVLGWALFSIACFALAGYCFSLL